MLYQPIELQPKSKPKYTKILPDQLLPQELGNEGPAPLQGHETHTYGRLTDAL